MKSRLILCLSTCLLAAGCADSTNPPPANNSSAALRSSTNPTDMRASAAYGGPSPAGQGPELIGPGRR